MTRARVSIDGSGPATRAAGGGGSSKAKGGGSSAAPDKNKKIVMLSVLGVALVGTAASIAFNMGLFGSGEKPPPPEVPFEATLDEKQKAQYQRELDARDKALKNITPAGS
jgi:hypothetical protein